MKFYTVIVTFIAAIYSAEAVNGPNLDKECLVPPPQDVDPMSCCKIPDLLDDALIDSCARKVFGNSPDATPSPSPSPTPQNPNDPHPSEPPFSPHIRCISECIFNETGILKDRVFHPEVAIDQARNLLGPKHVWVPIIETSVNFCNEYSKKTKFEDKKACGHLGAFLAACMNTQLFKNCPASSWSEGKGCAQLRETTVKCPVIAPIPPQD